MAARPRSALRWQLLLALTLTVVPGLALGYVGLRSVSEREAALQASFEVTTALVRDRVANELAQMELTLARDLGRSAATFSDPIAAQTWLKSLDQPWLASPVLLHATAGIITTELVEHPSTHVGAGGSWQFVEAIRRAEALEVGRQDLDAALRGYLAATMDAVRPSEQALVQSRLGRTLLKMHRFDEAAAAYGRVVSLGDHSVSDTGIPFIAMALSERVEAYAQIQRSGDQSRAQSDLLQYVVEHPWSLHGDALYEWFLERALAAPGDADPSLIARARGRQASAEAVWWIRQEVRPGVPLRAATGADRTRALFVRRGSEPVRLKYVHAENSDLVTLVYEVKLDYVAGPLLAEIVRTVNLHDDLKVGLRETPSRTDASESPLRTADLHAAVPRTEVALYSADGRSVDQLVARERWMYGALVMGIAVTLVIGVVFTLRAAAREAELSRMKTEFVSNVSHELKTPLALIRMFGETLESGIVGDQNRHREFSGIIRRESERLTHLVNNLLDVAKIEAGSRHYACTPLDLVALTHETLDAYQPFFERLGFTVTGTLPDTPLLIDGDRDAIAQALLNLFHNAVKFSADVKRVAVSVESDGVAAHLTVEDHGVGISTRDLPHVFDRYYRASSTAVAGTGLGLSVVKHVLDAHGGRATVDSTVGKGSRFTITLPLARRGEDAVRHA